jgi:peptide/nickel transport system ATP-binding protein
MSKPLLFIKDLYVHFNAGSEQKIHAVSGVSLKIKQGETMGLVGESGCGKSTIAKAVMQFLKPASGAIFFDGEDLTRIGNKRLRQLRSRFQMVFQHSLSSLNPKHKVIDIIAAPLKVTEKLNREQRKGKAFRMAASLGLDDRTCHRYPFQLSGGQCQRVQIARALMPEPQLLICDEPVSSLDASVQARVINLLDSLREKYRLTMLFISHDLAIVKNVCDRIAVMHLGTICELAPSEKLYNHCCHPYTQSLISAIPKPFALRPHDRIRIGEVPSPVDPPYGCRFHTRCHRVRERCRHKAPGFIEVEQKHYVACHFPNG